MIRYVLIALVVFSASSVFAQTGDAHSDIDLESDAEALVGDFISESELIAFGERLKRLILEKDIKGLKRYLKYGAGGPKDFYSQAEMYGMLDDKESWLYKRLFVGIGSTTAFFQRNKMKVVSLSGSGAYYVVSYDSSDGREKYDCSFLVFKTKGKMYIGEFPRCPSF
jgi:hypothetical protein